MKAYIFEHVRDDGSVEYRIYPPVVVLHGGETLEVDNRTDLDWEWDCPSLRAHVPVKKGPPTSVWTVPNGTPKQHAPCTMKSGNKRAIGMSDPMIIID